MLTRLVCLMGLLLLSVPAYSEASPEIVKQLAAHLDKSGKPPGDYIVSKFQKFDLVFVGEYHRVAHDPRFVADLIPRLYRAGVRTLGFEFGATECQATADAVLSARTYDESAVRSMMFQWFVGWPYKEYMDIYRAAWKLNRSLPAQAPKFRIVHLNYRPDWPALTGERTPEVMRRVWHKGDPDEYMASVVMKEIVGKGERALIYSGLHHAFTRYYQPRFSFQKQEFYGFTKNRMGNVVYRKVPGRVFMIALYAPWQSKADGSDRPPVGRVIDAVMEERRQRPVGFDVAGTVFGDLRDPDTYYAAGYTDFKLENLCDGYVYLKPFRDYAPVTVDPEFHSATNLADAIANLPNPEGRKKFTSVESWREGMRKDAELPAFISTARRRKR